MRAEWELITGNGLKLDPKYDGQADIMFDQDHCIVFTNIRPRSNPNPAPIVSSLWDRNEDGRREAEKGG